MTINRQTGFFYHASESSFLFTLNIILIPNPNSCFSLLHSYPPPSEIHLSRPPVHPTYSAGYLSNHTNNQKTIGFHLMISGVCSQVFELLSLSANMTVCVILCVLVPSWTRSLLDIIFDISISFSPHKEITKITTVCSSAANSSFHRGGYI